MLNEISGDSEAETGPLAEKDRGEGLGNSSLGSRFLLPTSEVKKGTLYHARWRKKYPGRWAEYMRGYRARRKIRVPEM